MNLYVVLYLPTPASTRVMEVRRAQKDTFRASLPVEITLAGSNGVGAFDSTQSLADAYKVVDRIAAQTAPIKTSFGPVVRFPGTDIFALTFEDDGPLRRLHEKIASSGIRFRTSPHRFTPHCTLRSRSPVTAAEERALLALRVPGQFTLDTMSVCGLDRPPVILLHTVPLSA